MKLLMILAVAAATVALLFAWSLDSKKDATLVEPFVVLSGSTSPVREREYHRIRNREDWRRLWCRLKGETPEEWQGAVYDRWIRNLPEVDFLQCEVVAILRGGRGHTGVVVESIDRDGVRFLHFIVVSQRDPIFPQPPPGEAAALADLPAAGGPYDLFVLPRTDLPLVIEERVQEGKTGEVRYVERARFD